VFRAVAVACGNHATKMAFFRKVLSGETRSLKNAFLDVTPCALVRIDVSEERIASIIRVTKTNELGTTLPVTSN
jgi:hypothetical protein